MNKKGFTLIELVLVMVIMGISSLGLVVVMQQVVTNIHKPQVIATATALAEKEMERLMRLSFSSTIAEAQQSYTGNFSAYTHTTTITSIDANNKEVIVTVTHPVIGSLTMAFLRTNY